MRVLQINATYKIGSTGKIMADLDDVLNNEGIESFMLCAYSNESKENLYVTEKYEPQIAAKKNILESRITGMMGYGKKTSTQKALKWIKDVDPDIIHIHNVHGNWINIGDLFNFIKNQNIKTVWTLHDCWPFTGRCSHFENIGCMKWKEGCYGCKNRNIYPITYFFDFSKKMWKDKKEWFSGMKEFSIVTPSEWLSKYVKNSFLSEYPIQVINNGIDTSVFRPVDVKSDYIRAIEKKIILGVASMWTINKGLNDFYKLNGMIDHSIYQIVLVGLNKKQLSEVPQEIVGIERTNNIEELVELYSAAEVFVNPTYLDNYPTVNLEAISCGTPVITYQTGGSPEIVSEEQLGCVVEQGNVEMLNRKIDEFCNRYNNIELAHYAKNHFDKNIKFQQYLNLYKKKMEFR